MPLQAQHHSTHFIVEVTIRPVNEPATKEFVHSFLTDLQYDIQADARRVASTLTSALESDFAYHDKRRNPNGPPASKA